MVRALIKMGSSATTCTEDEVCYQPVHCACANGHKELLCELVDNHGVDPHAEDGVSYFYRFRIRFLTLYNNIIREL